MPAVRINMSAYSGDSQERRVASERIGKLRKVINYHRALYHTFDAPEISDSAFDALKNELEELENKYPDFVTSDSPTQVVGGKPLWKFEKVQHEIPMFSFNDAFSEDEMREWAERVKNYLQPVTHKLQPNFYCELKIDGLAIELVYENGAFVRGSTRGDGKIGEDITRNLKTIPTIPQKLEKLGRWDVPRRLVVRGEVFITKKEFERINKSQEKGGEKIYANTRNLAAGSIRQLDTSVTASRKLNSFQYDIVSELNFPVATHEEKHKILASWGFTINVHNRLQNSLNGVFKFRDYWEKKREKLEYEIDGIVVIVNDNNVFNAAGVVGKAPRGAVAYKFSPREATTIVENVKIQVGRTGALTPVAELRPVKVGGITISRATLHNFDEIQRLGLKIGDTVIVSRAGDVIPKITKVIKELRVGKGKDIRMPVNCPVDGAVVIKDGVAYRCSNKKCGARRRELLYHFVSRGAFDIRGLGAKIIDRFLDEGLISDAADLFKLQEEDFLILESLPRRKPKAFLRGFGEKSAENIVSEIQSKKKIPSAKFLYSLGILHVGEETSQLLAQQVIAKIKNQKSKIKIDEILTLFKNFSAEDLQRVKDIGPKVAQSIYDWFHTLRNIKFLEKLEKVGVRIESQMLNISAKGGKSQKLANETFVFTGTLSSISRGDAKEKVRALGGDVSETVSKKTNYVVVGENPGSKYKMAQKLGVRVLDEEEFLKIINLDRLIRAN